MFQVSSLHLAKDQVCRKGLMIRALPMQLPKHTCTRIAFEGVTRGTQAKSGKVWSCTDRNNCIEAFSCYL